MEFVYDYKKNCCGCHCCEFVCPVKAIVLEEDDLGFSYPVIDQAKCINCGLCQKKCPMNNHVSKPIEKTYAAVIKDEDILIKSASGGAFYALASSIIEQGGIVFGCAFDEKMHAVHIEITDLKDLNKLQGSKYVQSELTCYLSIRNHLKSGKKVLFSGTPCQVAAVKSFVGENTNLLCIELVCHGVPNAAFWNDYLSFLEKKYKGKVKNFVFRYKGTKRQFCSLCIIEKRGEKKRVIIPSTLSYYYYNFLKGTIYRDSCYHCPFAKVERQADITICDFWGYNGKQLDDSKGISAIMVQGANGMSLIYSMRDRLLIEPSSFEDVSSGNEQLRRPSDISRKEYDILRRWKKKGAKAVAREHTIHHWKAYLSYKFHVWGR